jgi:site-specific DNA recombinase
MAEQRCGTNANKSPRHNREPKVRVRWLRTPIEIPRGRRLRVLIYSRFSTDEQRRRSIKAQIEYCKRSLAALGLTGLAITILFDEAISGELVSRPGIDQVREGIAAGAWDLIVVEDSSRLFRDEVACLQLVRLAVDRGIRTICLNDLVDTAESDWEQRLRDAALHHALSNRYCSDRIKRAHEELWESGAALGPLKVGYRRTASVPATKDEPEQGPFFDEVDPDWAPIIKGAYERIVAGQLPWAVADWLTEARLPKPANSGGAAWSCKNVNDLIRRPDYRGHQVYRGRISQKEYSTGKRRPKPNEPNEVLARDVPNLRIVEDWLWYAANAAIDGRRRQREIPRGRASSHYGIPRDSRGPLSGVFRCRCGAKMQVAGRIKGGYRCSGMPRGDCWNKATALRDEAHRRIAQAIKRQLEDLNGQVERLVKDATYLLEDAGQREARRTRLQQKKVELEATLERLLKAIELGKGQGEALVARLNTFEAKLDRINAKLDRLGQQAQVCSPPTSDEIHNRIREKIAAVEKMDRSSRDEIKSLVDTICAIPYQQFGGGKIVLRAKFTLYLASLLPARTRAALQSLYNVSLAAEFEQIPMVVDLFEPSTGPAYGLRTFELTMDGLGLTAIGERLGISKRRANIAAQYGEALWEAGLTDPYIELTEAPAAASRWRRHPREYHREHSGRSDSPPT